MFCFQAFEDASVTAGSTRRQVLNILNYIFATIFVIEMILKVIAFNLKGYFASGWNVLDFIIVAVS